MGWIHWSVYNLRCGLLCFLPNWTYWTYISPTLLHELNENTQTHNWLHVFKWTECGLKQVHDSERVPSLPFWAFLFLSLLWVPANGFWMRASGLLVVNVSVAVRSGPGAFCGLTSLKQHNKGSVETQRFFRESRSGGKLRGNKAACDRCEAVRGVRWCCVLCGSPVGLFQLPTNNVGMREKRETCNKWKCLFTELNALPCAR